MAVHIAMDIAYDIEERHMNTATNIANDIHKG